MAAAGGGDAARVFTFGIVVSRDVAAVDCAAAARVSVFRRVAVDHIVCVIVGVARVDIARVDVARVDVARVDVARVGVARVDVAGVATSSGAIVAAMSSGRRS